MSLLLVLTHRLNHNIVLNILPRGGCLTYLLSILSSIRPSTGCLVLVAHIIAFYLSRRKYIAYEQVYSFNLSYYGKKCNFTLRCHFPFQHTRLPLLLFN
jgi:hypothetical protein